MERPCVTGSRLASDPLVASRKGLKLAFQQWPRAHLPHGKVWSPYALWFSLRSHVGWGIFSSSWPQMDNPALLSALAQKKITGQLPSFSFLHMCVAMAKVNRSLGFIWSKISWAVCFLWALYRCFLNYLGVWGIFFRSISTPLPPRHRFEQFCRGRYSCWPPA